MGKYKFLTVASKVFLIVGWVAGIALGLIIPIAIFIAGPSAAQPIPRQAGFLWMAFGIFQCFWLMTISCLIRLLLDLAEKN